MEAKIVPTAIDVRLCLASVGRKSFDDYLQGRNLSCLNKEVFRTSVRETLIRQVCELREKEGNKSM